jgi:hypothetical protein
MKKLIIILVIALTGCAADKTFVDTRKADCDAAGGKLDWYGSIYMCKPHAVQGLSAAVTYTKPSVASNLAK